MTTAFGDFLRSRRERITPAQAGLPASSRRRTPGLRREEVAALAGIGVDWYVRLEQGRGVRPSQTTVDALATALRLDSAEQAHLNALARGGGHRTFRTERVPEPIRRLVEALPAPAYVTGRRWDVLAWNAAAADAVTDFAKLPPADRNILVYVLTDPSARQLFAGRWSAEARRIVAQFRTTHDLWEGDPAFTALIDRLRAGCPEFDGWWQKHDVRGTAAARKVLHHPGRKPREYEYATFQSNDDPGLKLAIYTPLA